MQEYIIGYPIKNAGGSYGKILFHRISRRADRTGVCHDAAQEGAVLLGGQRHHAQDCGIHSRGRKRLPQAPVHHRRQGLCHRVRAAADHGIRHRRPDALQVHPVRLCYGRRVLDACGLHRHAHRHQLQRPHCPGGEREPQPRPACCVLLRFRYGLHGRGSGHSGHHDVVLPAALCLWPEHAERDRQHHGHERHGRELHGAVCPRGRRHLHQGG